MSSIANRPADLAIQGPLESQTDQLLGAAHAKPADSKLKGYANKFEAILIGKWLEEAEDSFAKLPGDDQDPDADPGQDQFRSLAIEYMAQGMSAAGGFGISAMILKHLQKDQQKAHAAENKVAGGNSATASQAPAAGASTMDY